MRIICPMCELKGQVDVLPTGAKARIACVRCATTFDAVFVDGEIQALLPQASHSLAASEIAGNEVRAVDDVATGSVDPVFTPETLHENEFDASLQVEESPILADDFSVSSPDLELEVAAEKAEDAPLEISPEPTTQVVETYVEEATNAVQDPFVAAQPLKSNGAGKVSRPPTDAYGIGVRLMRVSPAWLLLAGLSFISFIVFCNWLIKPAAESGDKTSLIATANNHATNQSVSRVVAPASTAQFPVNNQVGQPSNQSGVAFIATEAKVETPPVAAPSTEPVAAKQPVEEKPASSPNRANEAKEGKVTIQIGSYNAASEAEARVANLKSAGFEARSVQVEIPKRGTWYRVQSGRFVSRDEADRYGKQLRDKGIVSSFITTDVQE